MIAPRRRFAVIVLAVLCTVGASCFAQSQDSVPSLKPFDAITNIPGDFVRWGEQTVQMENLPMIGLIAVSTGASMIVDHQVYTSLDHQYWKSSSFRTWSKDFVSLGNGFTSLEFTAAFVAYGAVMGDSKALRTGSEILEASLVVAGAVQLLKHVTGREFPVVATQRTGRWTFFPNQIKYFNHVPSYGAFPSGHLSTAAATLTVIQENYPDAPWISWIGYPALGGLAMGLTSTGLHWISDFPLALALGYSFGKIVAHPFATQRTDEKGGMQTSVSPMVFPNGTMGMGLAMAW